VLEPAKGLTVFSTLVIGWVCLAALLLAQFVYVTNQSTPGSVSASVFYQKTARISKTTTMSSMNLEKFVDSSSGLFASRTRCIFAGRWKNFAENIPVHVMNVAAGGTVTTAGQVNLPLDNTGLVPDEARVKRNRYGSKMSYMEVVSKCADTLLTSTLRRIVGHS
jgi:hypothetical protein